MGNVINNEAQNRYELQIDGKLSVADYRLKEGVLYINHVEVPEEQRGKGIAEQLMKEMLADAKKRELIVVPICSYAELYMQKNAI